MRLGVLFSSGKDSSYAAYLMKKQGHGLACLITVKSKNKDSFMFHTPNIDLVKYQAEAMGLPLIEGVSSGKKEEELKDLERIIIKAKNKHKIEGLITGALFSNYQKERIELIGKKLSLKVFSPLWHKNQEAHLRELIRNKFEIILTSVAADGLNKNWLGRKITNKEVNKLVELHKKNGLNIAGEGGEYESLVLKCPLFNKRLKVLNSEIVEEAEHSAVMVIKKAKLV